MKKQNKDKKQSEETAVEMKSRKKKVNFTEDTVDNCNEEPVRKKKKVKENDVTIQTREATEEELIECNKPENKKDIKSKRQMKREKHEALLAQQKLESTISARQKNLNYLSLWKHNRAEWKFNKVQQFWLQKNMLEVNMVPNDNFETLIEYFSGSKGQIRQTIIKDCMTLIDEQEKLQNEEISDELKIKFKRARNMLQSLQE